MPNKNGLILITPSSVSKVGTSSTATISANGSVSFSLCSSLSLNGVFSGDYSNYLVVARYTDSIDGTDGFLMRLRAAGTDNTGSTSYSYQKSEVAGTNIFRSRSATNHFYAGWVGGETSGAVVSIYGPYLAQPTAFRSTASASVFNVPEMQDSVATHNESTSYDGLTVLNLNGIRFGGRIAVYGLRE